MKIENYLINVEKLLDNLIITKDLNKRLNKIFKIKRKELLMNMKIKLEILYKLIKDKEKDKFKILEDLQIHHIKIYN